MKIFVIFFSEGEKAMEIYDFKINNSPNLLGVSTKIPRFSWKMKSEVKNTIQVYYKIKLFHGEERIWTKNARTCESVGIAYAGPSLRARNKYEIRLSVTDNYDHTSESCFTFETGKLDEPFEAKFIAPCENRFPIYALTRSIVCPRKVKSARLYATAHGLYEFYINDVKTGNLFFAPFWTDYRHTLEYQTYDVTELLKKGKNSLKMLIGKGWYAGALGFAGEKAHYGEETAGIAELRVAFDDGTETVVGTDQTWKAENTEILDSEFYYGETQDFTSQRETYQVREIPFGKEELVGQINEPVRTIEELRPVKAFYTPKNEYVLDFGQNLSGVLKLEVKGGKSEKIIVRHAEILDEKGNFYMENLRTAKSEDYYILSGKERVLLPHFTFHGFRYAHIIADEPEKIEATAYVLHSDMKRSGKFECSNVKINRLQSNILWGERGNFIDVPTDCPQRDERLGWTGDANVFFRTAAFNYDVSSFFDKWLRDVRTEQDLAGNVPHVIPNVMGKQDGAALWSDCATMIPWNKYLVYGDKAALEKQFLSMKKWVDYVFSKCGDNGLWQSGFQYGDWLALDSGKPESRTGASDKYFISNVFYYISTKIVADAAKELGKIDLFEEYYGRKNRILKAVRREYFTDTGRMVTETQTACALALCFDIVPKKFRSCVLSALKNNLAENRNHLNTGFAGTPFLLHALSENGEHETATKLLFNEDYPSWLYAVNMGATTIWERWNGLFPDGTPHDPAMNSFNHYAYGAVGDFLYRQVAGLNEGAPGYKKIVIKPKLTKNIESASAEYESVYGKIVCGYECKNGTIKIFAEIPCNTSATICLPETDKKISVGSGHYQYEYATSTDLTPKRFSLESTFGRIVAFKEGKRILEELSPGILDGPMIAFADSMTLSELCAYSGSDGEKLFAAVIDRMNRLDAEGKIL